MPDYGTVFPLISYFGDVLVSESDTGTKHGSIYYPRPRTVCMQFYILQPSPYA